MKLQTRIRFIHPFVAPQPSLPIKTGDWTRRQQQRDICNPFLGIPLAPPPTVFSSDEWRDSQPSRVEGARHALHGLIRFSVQGGVLNTQLSLEIIAAFIPGYKSSNDSPHFG